MRPLRDRRAASGTLCGISIRGRLGLEGPSSEAKATEEAESAADGCQGTTILRWCWASSQDVDWASAALVGMRGVAEESSNMGSTPEDESEDIEESCGPQSSPSAFLLRVMDWSAESLEKASMDWGRAAETKREIVGKEKDGIVGHI